MVDATPEDRAVKGCDADAAVSKQEIDTSVIGGSKGSQRFTRQQVFRIRSHHPTFTGPMGGGSRPPGQTTCAVSQDNVNV